MASIRVDTSRLTFQQFTIPGQPTLPADGSGITALSLDPGVYGFAQTGLPGFQFEVTAAGVVDFDGAADGFLQGRGTDALTVVGFPVTIDLTALSHGLSPEVVGSPPALTRDAPHQLQLIPSTYLFLLARGLADFGLVVAPDGQLSLTDSALAGCAQINGRTLTVTGYDVTFDLTNLSHGLTPELLDNPGVTLGRQTPTTLHLIPATYNYELARGTADFGLVVTRDGQLSLTDPTLAGCAQINGRTLTVTGYDVTFDLTNLSHGLTP
ncbi:hypothetical protein ACFVWU_37300, partial [Kitasatospora sp. NPDC058190]